MLRGLRHVLVVAVSVAFLVVAAVVGLIVVIAQLIVSAARDG